MALIKINDAALQTNSNNLSDRISELQEMNSRLENLIDRIESSWEGQSCRAYISVMRSHAIKSQKLIDVMTEYKNYVDSAIHKFSYLDSNSASRIRSSF